MSRTPWRRLRRRDWQERADAAIAAALRTFPGVEHRLEFVREHNGVRYYNDSKATNVDATEKAIDAFPGRLWIILGGKDKNSDYTVLARKAPAKGERRAADRRGGAEDRRATGRTAAGGFRRHRSSRGLRRAHRPVAGDVVLLAPACASFDQFENFEHRGRVFKELVRSL